MFRWSIEFTEVVLPSPLGKTHRNITALDLARYVDRPEGVFWLADALKKEGVACRYIVREGLAADTIVTVGHEEGVDMIVMYTDGRDGLADMLIGSITERVLRNTDIPLLAVRR